MPLNLEHLDEFDAADYLHDDEDRREYLASAARDGSIDDILDAISVIRRSMANNNETVHSATTTNKNADELSAVELLTTIERLGLEIVART